MGIFVNPIYGSGDFPERVKQVVKRRSIAQGYKKSRLPVFTGSEIRLLRGTADFFGMNFYTAVLVANNADPNLGTLNWDADSEALFFWNPTWKSAASFWLKVNKKN